MEDNKGDRAGWRWALAGTAVVATGTACYLAYRYYGSASGKGDAGLGLAVDESEVAHRLRLAKQLQMRTLMRTPLAPSPALAKPKAAAAPAGGRKTCAECTQGLTGLPQRCGTCKTTYYCSQGCQKKAWPVHKQTCKPAGGAAAPAPAGEASSSSGSPSAAAGAAGAAVVPACRATPQTMSEALASVLQESAAGQADEVEAKFETAVMLFLRADYRGAIELLVQVQALARGRGEVQMEGEVYKWLGHCWGKLSDMRKAETYFTEGAEFAAASGLPKIQLDCLGGLGMMCRAQDDPNRALIFLGKAMELAESINDIESTAAMLVNIGNVLMQVDPEKGLITLEAAVILRQKQIERLGEGGDRALLATAVMEHATAMVNLASALYVCKKMDEAKFAYERSLEVFEVVEDADKVAKVLINLANMSELQIKTPDAKSEAARYRDRLLSFLQRVGARVPEDTCAICLDPLRMCSPSEEGKELIMLACMHCLHDDCWSKHVAKGDAGGGTGGGGGVTCPTCRQPVLITGR
ncbi:hypothetical protein FOA52_007144 [Chlamydomonas sp. UWO 241]|nr:hypothetical protein FOA52_007144 [Chlamydomonas sp. UWO 241]